MMRVDRLHLVISESSLIYSLPVLLFCFAYPTGLSPTDTKSNINSLICCICSPRSTQLEISEMTSTPDRINIHCPVGGTISIVSFFSCSLSFLPSLALDSRIHGLSSLAGPSTEQLVLSLGHSQISGSAISTAARGTV